MKTRVGYMKTRDVSGSSLHKNKGWHLKGRGLNSQKNAKKIKNVEGKG
jgi:hypothetical protein